MLKGLLLILLLGSIACQTQSTNLPQRLRYESVSNQFLIQFLQKRQKEISNFKTVVKTTIIRKDYKQSFRQVLLVRGTDSIRVDTLNLFRQPIWVFVSNAKRTLLYIPVHNKVYTGWEVWDIMEKALGMVIDFSEYISVFEGNIPRLEELEFVSIKLDPEKKLYEIKAVDPSSNEDLYIELDAETLLPKKMIKSAFGRKNYIAVWEDYKMIGDRAFPHMIIINRPAREETLVLEYSSPMINQGVPAEGFNFSIPEAKKMSPPKDAHL
ncbi:MAG: DUF4292 domain-containing protein [Nitrospinae bacterium]|nr:DUF4292 domain-containing protein [Nitrospinota bacterium]